MVINTDTYSTDSNTVGGSYSTTVFRIAVFEYLVVAARNESDEVTLSPGYRNFTCVLGKFRQFLLTCSIFTNIACITNKMWHSILHHEPHGNMTTAPNTDPSQLAPVARTIQRWPNISPRAWVRNPRRKPLKLVVHSCHVMGPLADCDVREKRIYWDAVGANDDPAERKDSSWGWYHRRHDAFRLITLCVDGG